MNLYGFRKQEKSYFSKPHAPYILGVSGKKTQVDENGIQP